MGIPRSTYYEIVKRDRWFEHATLLDKLTAFGIPEADFEQFCEFRNSEQNAPVEAPYLQNKLPRSVTSFIGREREIAQLRDLLEKSPLLTLTGSGGCGKTRLALHVAREINSRYIDGVWLVELASLNSIELVPQAIASAFSIREQPGESLVQTLIKYLSGKCLLIVIDNCEHLLTACAEVANLLLRSCPQLHLLATSRERLAISGEQVYRVPSLNLPDMHGVLTVAAIQNNEAVRLFVDRAQLSLPEFTLTEDNAPTVASLCARLDGIPLALELAAVRLNILSLQEIYTRLDQRFRLLTGGATAAIPRQQSLHALIGWSYDLLSIQEKVLLSRMSVFQGGWTLEAAEYVATVTSSNELNIDRLEVFDLLLSLADKSLVIVDNAGDQTRYRLLEMVRQFAADSLRLFDDALSTKTAHRDYYIDLAEEIGGTLGGEDQDVYLDSLETEHDNLRLALNNCLEDSAAGEYGLRLCNSLLKFWEIRCHFTEGRQRLSLMLNHSTAQERNNVRANALNAAGLMAYHLGDYPAAQPLFEECASIWRASGDKSGVALAVKNLGIVAFHIGDCAAANAFCEESLEVAREIGDTERIAAALTTLSVVAGYQGKHDLVRTLNEECLAIYRASGNSIGIAAALCNLGNIAIDQNDYVTAREAFAEGLIFHKRSDNKRGFAYSLESFARLAASQGRVERTVVLMGAAAGLRALVHAPAHPTENEEHQDRLKHARSILGDVSFERAWSAGLALTWQEAADTALARPAE